MKFCFRFHRWFSNGIWIIPIYKKSAGAFVGLQPIGWLFNVMPRAMAGNRIFAGD